MRLWLFILLTLALPCVAWGQDRYSGPEFKSGYKRPEPTTPQPRSDLLEYIDVAVLVVALSAASWLAHKSRCRHGLVILTVLCLAYFGFYRGGCVCPVGAIQHVSAALFRPGFVIPVAVLAFFLLPLVFTLLFGRTFCGAVCPLGAVQDLVLLRPLKLPDWLTHALGLVAFVYLGVAVLMSAAGGGFVICKFDPFVSIFRLSGSWRTLVFTACFVLICVFVGRAYCRFLCPYGAILRGLSILSWRRVTISPAECVQCRLCEDACPFGAIRRPSEPFTADERAAGRKTLAVMLLLLPVLVAAGGGIGYLLGPTMSRTNFTVRLAEQVYLEEAGKAQPSDEPTDPAVAFRESRQPVEELYAEALDVKERFTIGGAIMGAFVGLIVGGKLISLSVRRTRTDYEADRATCLACGRCFNYCPVGRTGSREPVASSREETETDS